MGSATRTGAIVLAMTAAMTGAACSTNHVGARTTTTVSVGTGYGTPGVAADADETLAITIGSQGRYDVTNLQVRPGETVIFSVTNLSSGVHQFVVGDQQAQDAEEARMQGQGGSGSGSADAANAITVPPGATKRLVWAFPDAVSTVLFGSHEPGDYAGGLRGVIRVVEGRSNGFGQSSTTAPVTSAP
jgi:uncharacterized cupredoxin-like copper-binding protein